MAILNFNNTVNPYDAEVWSQKINGRLNGLENSEIPIAQQVNEHLSVPDLLPDYRVFKIKYGRHEERMRWSMLFSL